MKLACFKEKYEKQIRDIREINSSSEDLYRKISTL
jgi:hypothetical protein